MKSQLAIIMFIIIGTTAYQVFNEMDQNGFKGYQSKLDDSTRQLLDLEVANEKDFRDNLEKSRPSLEDWKYDLVHKYTPVMEGTLFCRYPTDFTREELPIHGRGFAADLKVLDVTVIDGYTGDKFPILHKNLDILAFKSRDSTLVGMRPLTVKVQHRGCVPMPDYCYATTTFYSWYSHSEEDVKWSHMNLNLATRITVKHCSVLRKIFNFWPFYHFF
ncbi:hypothetical protein L5515_018389 [Caenorhabditis briggsae]|uniref:Uncharacterized protein n=1 Tax=Caenorhabditis briggsae TaxID=6238 RepID=A0AAE9FHY0_CAEBR|nr:hypothetical protein L5515_018389 [Caenorhabditis briggsae]